MPNSGAFWETESFSCFFCFFFPVSHGGNETLWRIREWHLCSSKCVGETMLSCRYPCLNWSHTVTNICCSQVHLKIGMLGPLGDCRWLETRQSAAPFEWGRGQQTCGRGLRVIPTSQVSDDSEMLCSVSLQPSPSVVSVVWMCLYIISNTVLVV